MEHILWRSVWEKCSYLHHCHPRKIFVVILFTLYLSFNISFYEDLYRSRLVFKILRSISKKGKLFVWKVLWRAEYPSWYFQIRKRNYDPCLNVNDQQDRCFGVEFFKPLVPSSNITKQSRSKFFSHRFALSEKNVLVSLRPSHLWFTCSKSTMETPKQWMKSYLNLTRKNEVF